VWFPTPGKFGSVDPVVEVALLHLLKQLEHLFAKLFEFFECPFPIWFLAFLNELAFSFSLALSSPACFY